MNLSDMTNGELFFYGGLAIMAIAAIALMIDITYFSIRRRIIKKQLMKKYDFS
ncbi:hypothetical protein [Butyrivibrio fibrisolvens]|uniref:hypothetical protein n=1 Tax=Butyrivibrio fibrisolvens TaxID=831 RepID=UPI00040D8003|nr:hypothetical protein [Butyrivibrio fibrisolvens]